MDAASTLSPVGGQKPFGPVAGEVFKDTKEGDVIQ